MNLLETLKSAAASGVSFSVNTGDIAVKNAETDEYDIETVVIITPDDSDMVPFVIPSEDLTDEVRSVVYG